MEFSISEVGVPWRPLADYSSSAYIDIKCFPRNKMYGFFSKTGMEYGV